MKRVKVDHKDLKQNNQEHNVINRNKSVKSGKATGEFTQDLQILKFQKESK